jgi:hypothetical protein
MTLFFWTCLWHAPVRQVLTDCCLRKRQGVKKSGQAGIETQLTFFKNFTIPSCQFLCQVALFVKTRMDNPSSNFACNKVKCISIKRYQTWSMYVLYVSVNTAPSPITATDSSGGKVDNYSTQNQHPWHHSVDKNHFFCHVKFEVSFVISFESYHNPCSTKSGTFHRGNSRGMSLFEGPKKKKVGISNRLVYQEHMVLV